MTSNEQKIADPMNLLTNVQRHELEESLGWANGSGKPEIVAQYRVQVVKAPGGQPWCHLVADLINQEDKARTLIGRRSPERVCAALDAIYTHNNL